MEIIITINGTERTFRGDYDTLHTTEWDEIIRDLLDREKSYEQNHDKE